MSDASELVVERSFAVPRDVVWRAATKHLAEWWCVPPWTAQVVALDWVGGGRFAITRHGPDGATFASEGLLLDVVPLTRFVFTNVLGENWTPRTPEPIGIVGRFDFADAPGGGTRLRASARQWSLMFRRDALDFAGDWAVRADRLGAVAERLQEVVGA